MAGRAPIATKSSALIAMIADEVWLMQQVVLVNKYFRISLGIEHEQHDFFAVVAT